MEAPVVNLEVDLLERYGEDRILIKRIAEFVDANSKDLADSCQQHSLKKGDIVEFNGGYDNDIRYTSKIFAVDKRDGDMYVIWDCYWFPIRNEKSRNIIKL